MQDPISLSRRLAPLAGLCLLASSAGTFALTSFDQDGDGIPDGRDRCLYTAQGVSVDANGCALPSDQDQDGIPDRADACPLSPLGAEVDAQGCALDSDLDGVANGIDQCPATPDTSLVDVRGCPLGKPAKAVAQRTPSSKNELAVTPGPVIVARSNPGAGEDRIAAAPVLDLFQPSPVRSGAGVRVEHTSALVPVPPIPVDVYPLVSDPVVTPVKPVVQVATPSGPRLPAAASPATRSAVAETSLAPGRAELGARPDGLAPSRGGVGNRVLAAGPETYRPQSQRSVRPDRPTSSALIEPPAPEPRVAIVRGIEARPALPGRRYLTLYFEPQNATLTPDSQTILSAQPPMLLAQLYRNPRASLVVVGHSDPRLDGDRAVLASARRAEAVRQQLVSLGLSPERITVRSSGIGEPRFAGGEQVLNCRVELYLYEPEPVGRPVDGGRAYSVSAGLGTDASAAVAFQPYSTMLDPLATTVLDRFVATVGPGLPRDGSVQVRVVGSSDQDEIAMPALTLAQGRAAAVQRYLVSRGLRDSQVEIATQRQLRGEGRRADVRLVGGLGS